MIVNLIIGIVYLKSFFPLNIGTTGGNGGSTN